MVWRQYGERVGTTFNYLQNNIYPVMTDAEQMFCNNIRYLYWRSAPEVKRNGTQNQEPGSYVFYGAHVVVEDNGELANFWRRQIRDNALAGADRNHAPHGSSHYDGNGDQWEVHLPKLGCVLFGSTPEGHTFFQNESWAAWKPGLGGWFRWAAHGVFGFGAHALSGWKQVGALGYSIYTEKKNLQLTVSGDRYQQCKALLAPMNDE